MKKKENKKEVSISDVEDFNDYPDDTIFVLDETEGRHSISEILEMVKADDEE
ncbi:hypothetical protein [Youxingia wuxianensis]|uniref:Uncharacterized protein n=1 Tax=Youxingia wuxianensis TaxID=2763678 RepID=A0A926II46_9FIRM|nr:hypothetical protein [Youxingia wuxianensis]MBC8586604.1 hypothetical protein [Youxingia wuxianensis]